MSEHAWCRDPARDEAVRAAEDNREGPLPTLEECIETASAMMAKSVSSTSAVDSWKIFAEKSNACADSLRALVASIEEQLESVACRAATAETALEAAPAASGAAGMKPVAWMCEWTDPLAAAAVERAAAAGAGGKRVTTT